MEPTTNSHTKTIVSIVVIVIIIAALGYFGYKGNWFNNAPAAPDQNTVCTEEAMQCPDGSYVGRVPPSCDFAACPGTSSSTIDTSTEFDVKG